MTDSADIIIIGLGAWGAATAWQAAASGARVIGIDQFRPPHNMGSHTGTTRLARWSTSQDILYAPLTGQAFDLWRELEALTGQTIVETTGSLLFGPADHPARDIPIQTLESLKMPYEILLPDALRTRFPTTWCQDDEVALYEPNGARLRSAEGITAMHDAALRAGASLSFDERVVEWSSNADGVTVVTNKRTIAGNQLIITAGAWATDLLPIVQKRAVPERQVLVFFRPKSPEAIIPCLYWWQLHHELEHRGYGAFETDGRFKVAFHHGGATVHPDDFNRKATEDDIAPVVEAVRRRVPGLIPEAVDASICLYTNSDEHNHIDDEHWIVDRHPEHNNVVFATSCNGRGYRYAPAIGKTLTMMAQGQDVSLPDQLKLKRFAA